MTSSPPDAPTEPEAPTWSQRIVTGLTLVCIVGIVAEVGVWSYRRLNPPGFRGRGEQFPAVRATTMDGVGATLSPAVAEKPATLLFLLTTDCTFCQGNVIHWNEVYERTQGAVRVVALSLHDRSRTRRFIETFSARFPVQVIDDPTAFQQSISLPGVPLTLLLDSRGVIADYWYGPLSPEILPQIVAATSELVPELSGSFSSSLRAEPSSEAQR